jgi:hypothetical protein
VVMASPMGWDECRPLPPRQVRAGRGRAPVQMRGPHLLVLVVAATPVTARPGTVRSLASAARDRAGRACYLPAGLPARASALARTMSGSRGPGGRASRRARSRRALGLWMWTCLTVISSASRVSGWRLVPSRAPVGSSSATDATSRRCGGRHPKVHMRGESSTVGPLARRCHPGLAAGAVLADESELACPGDGLGAVGRAQLA